jgi:hypothetical protein
MTSNRNISKLGPSLGASGTVLTSNGTATYWATATVNASSGGESSPKIATIYVTDSSYNNLDDTAVDSSAGGYIKITGSNFAAGCLVVVGSVAATSTTFVSSSEVRAQLPAQAAGTYTLYLTNSDGGVAIKVLAINYSGFPSWTTGSSITFSSSSISYNFSASSDSNVVYSLNSGSSLPPGLSLSSNGLLNGTFTGTAGTVYTFTLQATDVENQNTPRSFSVTVSLGEPQFYLTTLLLHGDGTNGANNNTFVDSSTNNLSITRTGNTIQGSFSPFSQTGWSYYNNGTASTYVTVPYITTNFDWWTSDYTIEAWIYPHDLTNWSKNTVGSAVGNVVGNMDPSTGAITNYWSFGLDDSGHARLYYYNGGYNYVTSSATVNLNQWNHIGLVKTSSGVSILVNGVATSPTAISGTPQSAASVLAIGSYNGTSINGYISNLRIVKGTAVYSGTSYSVPTSPLTAITNTKFLSMQSNRFVDNSTVNSTFTTTLLPSIKPFSPFAPAAAYSTSTVGGSIFTGNSSTVGIGTSSLTVASNTAFGLGTGAFTVEFFIYQLSHVTGNYGNYFGLNNYANGINWSDRVNGVDPLYIGGTYYNWSPTTNVPLNQWTHMALVRNGSGVFRMFVNGSSVVTGTNAYDLGASAPIAFGDTPPGMNASGSPTSGYISNMRITNTAVYDPTVSTCTVPTAPLTAISGTKFLCTATNSGIFDQTAKNNLNTIGAAQVSTAQKKYGSGSMFFNNTSDGLVIPPNGITSIFGTGNFTIEFWMRYTTAGPVIADLIRSSTWAIVDYSNGNLYWQNAYASSSLLYFNHGSLADGGWHHVAIVRSGTNTLTMYVDGVSIGSGTDNNNYITNSAVTIAASGSYGQFLGYMDDIRITRYARYTSTFTPPTLAFSDQ